MDKQSVMEAFNKKFGDNPVYEDVKKYLYPRLKRKDFDDGLSDELVEISMLDFMIRFYVLVDEDENEDSIAAFPITMTLMDDWDLTMEQILQDALTNAQEMLPLSIQPIEEMLQLGSGEPMQPSFYVMSNRKNRFGAAAMLYKDALKDFSEKIDESFAIIPSSIHEVLLVPDSMDIPASELKDMLLDVNANLVRPDEILSQNIYLYNTDTGLRLAEQPEQKSE